MVMRPLPIVCLTALLILTRPEYSAAVDLQPHRAIYRILLSNTARNSDVVSANGTMVYRFARGCDGWTVENRTALRLLHEDDMQTESLWSFASWESMDGLKFRFHARYDENGKSIEKLEGEAQMEGEGREGRVRFSEPPDKVVPLPPGTLFPTEHVRQVIAAAGGGQHLLKRVVFDGASLDNPYTVNAAFGPLSMPAAEALAGRLKLSVQQGWWTRMAFFPSGSKSELPEFEMAAEYRADGIADKIVQYFEALALDVQVKEIELLPAPDC
jgi:hypothetical protein